MSHTCSLSLSLSLSHASRVMCDVDARTLCVWGRAQLTLCSPCVRVCVCWGGAQLTPMFRRIKLDLHTLNNGGLVPRKDYHSDMLSTSLLQVPDGCMLLLDQTQPPELPADPSASELSREGHAAISTLRVLANSQLLPLDFQFFQQVPINPKSETRNPTGTPEPLNPKP